MTIINAPYLFIPLITMLIVTTSYYYHKGQLTPRQLPLKKSKFAKKQKKSLQK